MQFGLVDWLIVAVVFISIVIAAYYTKRYTNTVADYLAAGRCARRYLLSIAVGVANLGAITIIAHFEMFYKAGFVMIWWSWPTLPIYFIIALSGWVAYRFRQTRSLTLAQFFETRYNKKFRVFAGSMAFASGVMSFSIAPAIGAKFFMNFCELPNTFLISSLQIPVFPIVMLTTIIMALICVFWGGQIVLIVTDALQGIFCNIVFMAVLVFFFLRIDWSALTQTLLSTPPGESLINPFDAGKIKHFDVWYILIGVIGAFYNTMSWPVTQGFTAAAKTPHEARMGNILSSWRTIAMFLLLIFMPVCAYAVMHNPVYAQSAAHINTTILDQVQSSASQAQLVTPAVLKLMLPVGLLGCFAAMMLATSISANDTQMHVWGSVLVQDVILPLRKKPLGTKQHLLLLRVAIVGVAAFCFIVGLFYNQSQHLLMFFAITSAVFMGGIGSAVIGGLYWRKGTTSGAFAALITGSTISVCGLILNTAYDDFVIDGQWFYLLSICGSILVYVLVSLMTCKRDYDLDKLLHKGLYAIVEDAVVKDDVGHVNKFYRTIGIDNDFSNKDRIIYLSVIIWGIFWLAVFVTGMFVSITFGITSKNWLYIWYTYSGLMFVIGLITTIWFTFGGIKDLRLLFRDLKLVKAVESDDGTVEGVRSEKKIGREKVVEIL